MIQPSVNSCSCPGIGLAGPPHVVHHAGKMIAPVYEQLSRDFPDVRFYKVDIDKDQVSSSVAASNVSAVVRPSGEARAPDVLVCAACCGDGMGFGSVVLGAASWLFAK